MGFWSIFWLLLIIFTLCSFTYMSVKILYYGFAELKYMLKTLGDEQIKNDK
jgi:hypothetical protein